MLQSPIPMLFAMVAGCAIDEIRSSTLAGEMMMLGDGG